MRKQLIDKYNSIPGKQVEPGIYVKTFGYKWVTLLNVYGKTHVIKSCYTCFINGDYLECDCV